MMKSLKDTNRRRLVRSESLSDLTLVCQVRLSSGSIWWISDHSCCQDGLAYGHQVILASHSPWLREIFLSSCPLSSIVLLEVPGLPSMLKVKLLNCSHSMPESHRYIYRKPATLFLSPSIYQTSERMLWRLSWGVWTKGRLLSARKTSLSSTSSTRCSGSKKPEIPISLAFTELARRK